MQMQDATQYSVKSAKHLCRNLSCKRKTKSKADLLLMDLFMFWMKAGALGLKLDENGFLAVMAS